MKRFFASFDVVSEMYSLAELETLLGEKGSDDSFDRLSRDVVGRPQPYTMLRIASQVVATASADEHVSQLRTIMNRVAGRLRDRSLNDHRFMLNIALFFDTAAGSLDLTPSLLCGISLPYELSISCYPVSDAATDAANDAE